MVEALVFDAYGTLFDVGSVKSRAVDGGAQYVSLGIQQQRPRRHLAACGRVYGKARRPEPLVRQDRKAPGPSDLLQALKFGIYGKLPESPR